MDIRRYRRQLKNNGVRLSIEEPRKPGEPYCSATLRIQAPHKLNGETKAKIARYKALLVQDLEEEEYNQGLLSYVSDLGGQVTRSLALEPHDVYGTVPSVTMGKAKAYFTYSSIFLDTPWDEDFLEALKETIPPMYRRWLAKAKVWHIRPGKAASGRAFSEEILLLMAEFYDRSWYEREYL